VKLFSSEMDATAAATESGLSMTTIGIAVAAIVVIGLAISLFMNSGDNSDGKPSIELHPDQLKFMEEKEEQYCGGCTKGKGIRCIIDYMREATDEIVKECLTEKPKYTSGFVPVDVDVHGGQFDWLIKQGVSIDFKVQGAERYKDVSSAFRAMLNFAMRAEAEGNKRMILDMYENVRCLNC